METSKLPGFYVNPERMKNCIRNANVLQAKVIGNAAYRVRIDLKKQNPADGNCTCPAYRNNANCKHIVAVKIAFKKYPAWFKKSISIVNNLRKITRNKLLKIYWNYYLRQFLRLIKL